MGNTDYVALNRQSGLMREMEIIANNIANAATTGYRREGLVFSEFVAADPDGGPSISMANGNVRLTSRVQGSMTETGSPLDLAIEGDGFFMVETPAGNRLTRAGSFGRNTDGELVTPDGYRLLDVGGAPVFAPADAGAISVSPDGTVAGKDGPLAQIGVFLPQVPNEMSRHEGTLFSAPSGYRPVDDAKIRQGFLENSNVSPVAEVARMIEVQRAYEMGQALLAKEDERIRGVISTLGRQ